MRKTCRSTLGHTRQTPVSIVVIIIAFIGTICGMRPAQAATIEVIRSAGTLFGYEFRRALAEGRSSDVSCSVRLTGEIVIGDAARFQSALSQLRVVRNFAVCLDSRGGSYAEALNIAEMILTQVRRSSLSIATVVPRNAHCYSACALIFLSGSMNGEEGNLWQLRWLHVRGRLGFHAPYLPDGTVAKEDQAHQMFAAGIMAVRRLLNVGQSVAGAENMKRQVPLSLILKMLEMGPSELFEIDTVQRASQFRIDLIGFKLPAKLSTQNLCSVCRNENSRTRGDNDLLATGDCTVEAIDQVTRSRRRAQYRGVGYSILDFGGYGAEGAYYCSVVAQERNRDKPLAWQFLGSGSLGVPAFSGDFLLPVDQGWWFYSPEQRIEELGD